jgi:hypothetical protein
MTAAPCTGERPLSEETSMAQHSPLVPRDSRALDPDDFSFFGFDDSAFGSNAAFGRLTFAAARQGFRIVSRRLRT